MYIDIYISFGAAVLLLVIAFILSVVCANIAQSIDIKKGYSGSGGFWTGWLFWFIGIAIIMNKADIQPQKVRTESKTLDNKLIASGGWRCSKCSTVNASYVTTCPCGLAKADSDKASDER